MRRAACNLVLVLSLAACSQPADLNPNARSPWTKEQQAAAFARSEEARALAKQVEDGEIGLDEAACINRGGDYDFGRDLCERHLVHRKAEAGATQDAILAIRLAELAGISADRQVGAQVCDDAADGWLRDHPEDYLGAVFAAVRSLRKARLIGVDTPGQAVALNRITSLDAPVTKQAIGTPARC
jgi:hypothetical protein